MIGPRLAPCGAAPGGPTVSTVTEAADSQSLTGQLLVAMPGMGDPRFEHGVVYLCNHSDEGAMGLIVNKPAGDLSLKGLLDKLEIRVTTEVGPRPIHFGGPVETGRGFVLHTNDFHQEGGTLDVGGGIGMTATLDVLAAIASGKGPGLLIVALGYAGWGPGQLEDEIAANGWLTCDASPELVFRPDDSAKWIAALATLGVDALSLSSEAGHA